MERKLDVDGTDMYIILKAVAIYQRHSYEPSVIKEAWERFAKFAQEQFPVQFDQDELEDIWEKDVDC